MKIAGVKAVCDPPVGLVQRHRLSPHRPLARKGPVVEPQPLGDSIDLMLVQHCATGRRKVLGALIADIVFRRLQVAPIGFGFGTSGNHRGQSMTDVFVSGFFEQLPDDPLGLFVAAFAELMMPDAPLRIDDVERRPIVIVERPPHRKIIVDGDGIIDFHLLRGLTDVVDVSLKHELGRVHADNDQSLVLVSLGPRAHMRKCAEPIDTGVSPEVDENDLPAQVRRRQRPRVEPPGRAGEGRCLALALGQRPDHSPDCGGEK